MEVVNIPLDAIELGERLREVDRDHAAVIAESFRTCGQMAPVEVQEQANAGRFLLVSGAHRVAAARALGWESIAAVVFGGEDGEAFLRQIEENLARHDLTPLDRATFLAERKRIYEELYPQTKQGKGRLRDKSATGYFCPPTFTKEISRRLGLSENHVKRAVMRFKYIDPDVRRMISGTVLATKGSELDALSKLDADDQRAVAEIILSCRAGNVAGALRLVRALPDSEVDANELQFRKLLSAWMRAGNDARAKFLRAVSEDISKLKAKKGAVT